MLLRALGLLLLLDGGDDTPGSTAGADDILVGDGEKVTLIDGKLASDLTKRRGLVTQGNDARMRTGRGNRNREATAYVGNFL